MKLQKILLLVIFCHYLQAETIGSNSRPCRFNDVVGLGTNDSVLGFAALNGGLRLFNSSTVDEFDSLFSVQGPIDLRGGTLTLNQDLILQNISQISSVGTIIGNGHVLSLSKNIECVPTGSGYIQPTCEIVTTGVSNTLATNQTYQSMEWSFDNKFVAAATSNDSGIGAGFLRIFDSTSLALLDSETVNEDYTSVAWNPVQKNLLIVGREDPGGAVDNLRSFSVNSTGMLTLVDSAEPNVDVRQVAYHPNGEFVGVGTTNTTGAMSVVRVYAVDQLGNLTLIDSVSRASLGVRIDAMDWDPSGCFLVVGGFSETAGAVTIYSFDGSTLTQVDNEGIPTGVVTTDWNPIYPKVIVSAGSSSIQLLLFDYDSETVSSVSTIVSPGNFIQKILFDASGQCLGVGANSDPEIAIYSFNPNNNTVTLVDSLNITPDASALGWSQGKSNNVVFGTDFITDDTIELFNVFFEFVPVISCFEWGNLDLCLNSNVCFQDCCITFTGNSTINGQGNCLTLKPTCTIQIASNSSLLMKNIIVQGLQASNILALDSTSTVSLKSAKLFLGNDFDFTAGSLQFFKNVSISGVNHTFNYQTSQNSVINANSTLKLNNALTFNYAPTPANTDLLELADNTSVLFLKGATLKLTTTNLQLTKGVVSVDRNSTIESI